MDGAFIAKILQRNKWVAGSLSLSSTTLVMGDHHVMNQSFRYLSGNMRDLPINPYPKSMRQYLGLASLSGSIARLLVSPAVDTLCRY